MKPQNISLLAGVCVFGSLSMLACTASRSAPTFDKMVLLAESIKVGTSKADVIKLLGEPSRVIAKAGRESQSWQHPSDGYSVLILNFEHEAFTLGAAFLKDKKAIKLGTAKKGSEKNENQGI